MTSWAIVEYFLRPKPAYFTIKRELASFSVGMTRKEHKKFNDARTAVNFTIRTEIQVWGTNSTLEPLNATLEIAAFDLESDWTNKQEFKVTLAANASTELWTGDLPGQPVRTKASEVPRTIIISARLLSNDGRVLARYANW